MRRLSAGLILVAVGAAAIANSTTAQADFGVPAEGLTCLPSIRDAMTVLPNGRDFLICQAQGDSDAYTWASVVTPFSPSDTWLSYGPEITLHGEGFRNPNLTSGEWTATPQDPATQCGASQVMVIGPGRLAPAQVSQGEAGQPLSLQVLPKLFTIALSGDCLWTKTSS